MTEGHHEDIGVSPADVADSRSASSWSVEERAWKQDLPDLPDDVIALLAPPVVVTAHENSPEIPLSSDERRKRRQRMRSFGGIALTNAEPTQPAAGPEGAVH